MTPIETLVAKQEIHEALLRYFFAVLIAAMRA